MVSTKLFPALSRSARSTVSRSPRLSVPVRSFIGFNQNQNRSLRSSSSSSSSSSVSPLPQRRDRDRDSDLFDNVFTQFERYDPFSSWGFLVPPPIPPSSLSSMISGRNSIVPNTFGNWAPQVDITENDKMWELQAELPGVKASEVKVRCRDGVLTIEGEKKLETKHQDKLFKRVERRYGSFVRRFSLPDSVVSSSITATFDNGLLKIAIQKSHDSHGDQGLIPIQVQTSQHHQEQTSHHDQEQTSDHDQNKTKQSETK